MAHADSREERRLDALESDVSPTPALSPAADGSQANKITALLQHELGTTVTFVGLAPGASHEGWIFLLNDQPGCKVVVRLEPEEGPFLDYDGAMEVNLLNELAQRGLAVPRVLASGDAEILGSSFMVLEWIEGDVLNPRVAANATPARRTALAQEMASTLAKVHAIPWAELSGPSRPFLDMDTSLAGFFSQFDRSLAQLRLVDSLVLDYVRVWLAKHSQERDIRQSLVHGDFRLGNLVWQGDSIAGILDWETARIGDPLFDIAWMCMGATQGSQTIMGLVTRDEFVDMYARASKRPVVAADLVFWQVAAAWVRGCTEARLLDIAIMSHSPAERDARDLSWEFGSARTEEELLLLIDGYEGMR